MITTKITTLLAALVSAQAFCSPRIALLQPTALLGAVTKIDYEKQVGALASMMSDAKDILAQIKFTANELRQMETDDPHLADNTDGALRLAVAEAKAACDAYGPHSAEAELAFWDVDNVVEHERFPATLHPSVRYSAAAIKAHHNFNAVLDTQLLQDAVDAIEKLETLDHFAQVEHKRLDGADLSP